MSGSPRRPRGPLRVAFVALVAASALVGACGWDPSRPFEREAPEVKEAIFHLDGGDASAANALLEAYLATGACKEGSIGTPARVKERPNGSFDLGLGLFRIAEAYGRRFGDEEGDPNARAPEPDKQTRGDQVECALRVVRAVAEDATQDVALRARARYLEGNLLFLNGAYEEAVRAYEKALEIAPGMPEGGVRISAARSYGDDPVGRDAAWNRAVALRRIEDKKDGGKDAANDAPNDGSGDGGGGKNDDDDKKKDGGTNGADGGGKDGGGKDGGAQPDSGSPDDAKKNPPRDSPPPPAPDTTSRQSQDERMLDQLEPAPTVQGEAAKKAAQKRRVRGMEDK